MVPASWDNFTNANNQSYTVIFHGAWKLPYWQYEQYEQFWTFIWYIHTAHTVNTFDYLKALHDMFPNWQILTIYSCHSLRVSWLACSAKTPFTTLLFTLLVYLFYLYVIVDGACFVLITQNYFKTLDFSTNPFPATFWVISNEIKICNSWLEHCKVLWLRTGIKPSSKDCGFIGVTMTTRLFIQRWLV